MKGYLDLPGFPDIDRIIAKLHDGEGWPFILQLGDLWSYLTEDDARKIVEVLTKRLEEHDCNKEIA